MRDQIIRLDADERPARLTSFRWDDTREEILVAIRRPWPPVDGEVGTGPAGEERKS